MPFEPSLASGWRASLALGFERRGERSVLAERRHDGPLVVQKPLYPEGDDLCHAIVVHPPGGIAGGDDLDLAVHARERSRALLTTPGAAKWYRTSGAWAKSRVRIEARNDSILEWLPQETIVFDGARADIRIEAHLEGNAALIAFDIVCLGRTGSSERFAHGACRLAATIHRDGRLAWTERARIDPGGAVHETPAGLAGQPVFGTFIAAARDIPDAALSSCREERPREGMVGVTRLPGVLLARYRGASTEGANEYFRALWRRVRPLIAGREAIIPRIWST